MGSADIVARDNLMGVDDIVGLDYTMGGTTGGVEGEGYFAGGAIDESKCTEERDMGLVILLSYLELLSIGERVF